MKLVHISFKQTEWHYLKSLPGVLHSRACQRHASQNCDAFGTVGRAGAAGGMAEGIGAGAAGAGTMAGYEAMQRGMSGDPNAQGATSEQQPPASMDPQSPVSPGQTGPYGDVWADEKHQDPWGQEMEDPWSAGDDDGGDGGGDDFDFF